MNYELNNFIVKLCLMLKYIYKMLFEYKCI